MDNNQLANELDNLDHKKQLLETNIYNLNCIEKEMTECLDGLDVKKEAVWEKVWQKNQSL